MLMARDGEAVPEWFEVVELEVNSMCNRVCGYCPVAVLPKVPPVPKVMPDEVLERALAELESIGFDGRISYHFYNEPLVRKDLERVVGRVRAVLPAAFQLLYTNGDLLTDSRQAALMEAGLDHTLVTRHEPGAYPERPDQTIQWSHELVLTNRAGILTGVAQLERPSAQPCFAPTDMCVIAANGDVLMCCDDARRTQVFGNVLHQSIEEIWYSERFVGLRRLLQAGRRAEASPSCAKCSSAEYFAPGEAFWADPFKDETGWVSRSQLRGQVDRSSRERRRAGGDTA